MSKTKWEIESVINDEGPTMTVRVTVTKKDGTTVIDQRSMPDSSTKEDITLMCEELCTIHDTPQKKELPQFSGMKGAV